MNGKIKAPPNVRILNRNDESIKSVKMTFLYLRDLVHIKFKQFVATLLPFTFLECTDVDGIDDDNGGVDEKLAKERERERKNRRN